ncbi:hypothetical protein CF319_g4466 [Tilletia indica]|nr:hypothetical protein CF319_g4466 [Tilletia indica]
MSNTPIPEDYYPSPTFYITPAMSIIHHMFQDESEQCSTESSAPPSDTHHMFQDESEQSSTVSSAPPPDGMSDNVDDHHSPLRRPPPLAHGGQRAQTASKLRPHAHECHHHNAFAMSELNYVPTYAIDLPPYNYARSARSADQWHLSQDPDPERYACTGTVFEYVDEMYMNMWASEWRHVPDPAFQQTPSDAEW